jgi:tetrahydromethanopterin S-methyltransferase subunit F
VGERQRLAGLAATRANGLLVMFVLAVALPLLPPNLVDPFWLLAFTGAF